MHIYIYRDIVYNERVITEYWPMRMIISMKGEWRYVLSHFAVGGTNYEKINEKLSS